MHIEYLRRTESIDYENPAIQDKANELRKESSSQIEYAERAFRFVRDEIPHSWDIKSDVVSRKASEALINRTGICWTKSCLLASLRRANGIPSGLSYQRLTRADDNVDEGYSTLPGPLHYELEAVRPLELLEDAQQNAKAASFRLLPRSLPRVTAEGSGERCETGVDGTMILD